MVSLVPHVDLNADVGENPAALADGTELSLIKMITSANIACGGHAGDEGSMRSVVALCKSAGVAVGAHPGYPDCAGFGRQPMTIPGDVLDASLRQQVHALRRVAGDLGVTLHHVKPHGALYNVSAVDASLAKLVALSVAAVDKNLALVGLAGSPALDEWRKGGFFVVGEAFADRRYEPDGSLRLRKYDDAVIEDPVDAARQAVDIVCRGGVTAADGSWLRVHAQTLCVHGDTKNVVAIASAVRRALGDEGVQIAAFSSLLR